MSYLGLDLGTSGLRALLVDSEGGPLASAERPLAVSHPHFGWAEQDPSDWITALNGVMDELRSKSDAFGAIAGIGVAGHMHGATLLDSQGTVLRPCILWNDMRAHLEAAALDKMDRVRTLSGNIVFPGFTAPKLVWVETHEPEIFRQIDMVLLPAAYLNFYLSGDAFADMSDSAGTSWLDVGKRSWSETLLEAGHMRAAQMPRLVEGCQRGGTLRRDLAARWGLGPNVAIAGGAGDNAAAACGIGALREGQGFVSLGTSGVVLVAREACAPRPESAVHSFCHAVHDSWYQMGVMLSATDSLNWLSRLVGQIPADLTAELGGTLLPPGRELFLPYLSGERTPHNDANMRASFSGLSIGSSRQDVTKAVLEGVAFGLRDSLEALKSTGAQIEQLAVIGGGARSDYWVKLIATVFGVPLRKPTAGEFGAALGAARLGICAATGLAADAVMTAPYFAPQIDPDLALRPQLDVAYAAFQNAYQTSGAMPRTMGGSAPHNG